MKFNKKIVLVSVAALMGISPVMSGVTNPDTAVTQAATYQQRTLTFGRNSYVYNKNGKRLYKFRGKTAYFRKNSKLKAPIVTSDTKTHYFTYGTKSENYRKVYLKVYTIKGKKYYNIGHGGYINIANIDVISNHVVRTDLDVRVRINKAVRTVSADGTGNNTTLKKGAVITADGYGQIPGGEWVDSGVPAMYYHIKGTKDSYVIDDHTTLLSPVQNGNEFTNLYATSGSVNGKETEIYGIDGKNMFPGRVTAPYQGFDIDAAMYLWNSSTNRVELFYHVTNSTTYTYDHNAKNKGDRSRKESLTKPAFVKASSIDLLNGAKPKTINTASDAQNGNLVANSTQKSPLASELSKAKTVQASLKYKNSSKKARADYDKAVANGESVNSSSKVTINEITLVTWQIKNAEKSLTGERIKVAYPNFLTVYDRTKIKNAAMDALGDRNVDWANHDRELRHYIYTKGSDDVSYKVLDINDYITADTPKIKNKKGYSSSATPAAVKKDATLAKYADMLDYNMRKSALVARRNTPVYTSTTKVGAGANFNVNKLNLRANGRRIAKGNNIAYYATLVVKIKGQYYFMIQEKSTYFVKAKDVKLDNFSTSATYKKYQKKIDDMMGPKQQIDFGISALAKRSTTFYNTDRYMELTPTKRIIKKGRYVYFVDPYTVKYNGKYYYTGGSEFNSDYDPEGAVRCYDISKFVKGQKF